MDRFYYIGKLGNDQTLKLFPLGRITKYIFGSNSKESDISPKAYAFVSVSPSFCLGRLACRV